MVTPTSNYCPPIDQPFRRKLMALVVVSYTILAAIFCVGVFSPLG